MHSESHLLKPNSSNAWLKSLNPKTRAKLIEECDLSEEELEIILHDWSLWGREEQQEPDVPYHTWLILAGRGWGKTRTGAEWVHGKAQNTPGCVIAIVASTIQEAEQIMVQGESGIIATQTPWNKVRYIASQQKLEWENGSIAYLHSGANPESLRGYQFHYAWCDELVKWEHIQPTWDNLMLGLRLGDVPQTIVTTTPKPLDFLKQLANDSGTIITRGSTFDNSDNLASGFIDYIKARYVNSHLAEQELYGEIVDEVINSLWDPPLLSKQRYYGDYKNLDIIRVIISVDPAVTSNNNSDETGIMVMCLTRESHVYVLEDLSGKFPPHEWAAIISQAYASYEADCVVAEVNMGGDMVRDMLKSHDYSLNFKSVRATRGKYVRAEPVANLYREGKIWHLSGLDVLEKQLISYNTNAKKSPDRMDALVWGVHELLLQGEGVRMPRITFL